MHLIYSNSFSLFCFYFYSISFVIISNCDKRIGWEDGWDGEKEYDGKQFKNNFVDFFVVLDYPEECVDTTDSRNQKKKFIYQDNLILDTDDRTFFAEGFGLASCMFECGIMDACLGFSIQKDYNTSHGFCVMSKAKNPLQANASFTTYMKALCIVQKSVITSIQDEAGWHHPMVFDLTTYCQPEKFKLDLYSTLINGDAYYDVTLHVQEYTKLTLTPYLTMSNNPTKMTCVTKCERNYNCTAMVYEFIPPFHSICYLFNETIEESAKLKVVGRRMDLYQRVLCVPRKEIKFEYKDRNLVICPTPVYLFSVPMVSIVKYDKICNKKMWKLTDLVSSKVNGNYTLRRLISVQQCLNECSEGYDCAVVLIDYYSDLCIFYDNPKQVDFAAGGSRMLEAYDLICVDKIPANFKISDYQDENLKKILMENIEIIDKTDDDGDNKLQSELIYCLVIGICTLTVVFTTCLANLFFRKQIENLKRTK